MPIILKGIQTWEDAVLAVEAGVQGVVLSNHGGRQMDMAKSGLEILVEVIPELKRRSLWPNPNFHIFVDGRIRRASDALKALALGASAVGIGKGFLYSYCAYGQDGVEHAIKILKDEMCVISLYIAPLSHLFQAQHAPRYEFFFVCLTALPILATSWTRHDHAHAHNRHLLVTRPLSD